MSAHDDLVSELVRLRRGWGLQSRTLRGRLGPQLTRLCAIVESDSSRRIQEKFRSWLIEASAELPPKLARAIVVAYALDRAHQHPTLTERVEALATEQSWGLRTARRRIDHATRSVAQAALERTLPDGESVYAGRSSALAAVVRLDATRRDAAGTDAVVLRVPVPSDRFDLLIRFEAS
jgi:hypothetical protein